MPDPECSIYFAFTVFVLCCLGVYLMWWSFVWIFRAGSRIYQMHKAIHDFSSSLHYDKYSVLSNKCLSIRVLDNHMNISKSDISNLLNRVSKLEMARTATKPGRKKK